jgi:diadenosine tetraphosphate (Ap4A) HIT family hydrolase
LVRTTDLYVTFSYSLSVSWTKTTRTAVKKIHSANSMTLTVQDGEDAGQTVFHVHVHVMPRKPNDFARNDDVYEKLEKCEEEERNSRMDFAEDGEERTPRGEEEMEKEATELRRAMTMEES